MAALGQKPLTKDLHLLTFSKSLEFWILIIKFIVSQAQNHVHISYLFYKLVIFVPSTKCCFITFTMAEFHNVKLEDQNIRSRGHGH